MAGVTQSTISASENGSLSAGLLTRLIAIYRPEPEDLADVLSADGAMPVPEPDGPDAAVA